MKQRDSDTFFLDRSLGREVIADALREKGIRVEIHDSHFPSDAKDEDWLAKVGGRGWIVLTKDRRFHTRVLEITAIARSNARIFKLTAANLQGPEMAAIFVKAIQKISRIAASNPGPFIASVSRSGKVSMVLRSSKLKKFR